MRRQTLRTSNLFQMHQHTHLEHHKIKMGIKNQETHHLEHQHIKHAF